MYDPTMMEAHKIAHYCKSRLPLSEVSPIPEYGYAHLPLCIIDSVWSIGVRYGGVTNVIERYCVRYGIDAMNAPIHTVSELIKNIEVIGVEMFASGVAKNLQRTSSKNGLLKAEAVLMWAKVLQTHGIETLTNLPMFGDNGRMETSLRSIPGQGSGISLRYFFMLCGDETLIKPDRMTQRFLETALGRNIRLEEMQDLYADACTILNGEHPLLTPRRLDNAVWNYQRTQ